MKKYVALFLGLGVLTLQAFPLYSMENQVHSGLENLQVDPHSGSANLSYPIAVSRGRGGIQPNLSLSYNSNHKNGMLGMGWGIEFGSIMRSTKSGPPQYDESDMFVLNQNGSAQELVLDSNLNFYRTKAEGAFLKAKKMPQHWVVTDRNGVKYFFGEEDGDRERDPNDTSKVLKWALNKVEDVHGNFMEIDYERDGELLYPKEARYTGNSAQGLDPFAKVILTYEDREDVLSSYIAGIKLTTAKRLKRIEVKVEEALQRRYELTYALSGDTRRSLLTKIEHFGSDDATMFAPTVFSYSTAANGSFEISSFNINNFVPDNLFNFRYGGTVGGHENIYSVLPNGLFVPHHGIADWGSTITRANCGSGARTCSQFGGGQVRYWGPKDTSFHAWTYLYVDGAPKNLSINAAGDVYDFYLNGSQTPRRAPLNYTLNSGYNVLHVTGYNENNRNFMDIYTNIANQVDSMNSTRLIVPQVSGDFNADGYMDILTVNTNRDILVDLSQGEMFLASDVWGEGFGPDQNATGGPEEFLQTGDFNGDGRSDVLIFHKSDGSWKVALSDGEQFLAPEIWRSGFGADEEGFAADMNGDGKSDIVTFYKSGGQWTTRVAVSDGDGTFTNAPEYTFVVGADTQQPLLGNWNGDGLMDFGAFNKSNGSWTLKMNTGNVNDPLNALPTISGYGADKNTVIADFNADGLTDIGYYDPSTGEVYCMVSSGAGFSDPHALPLTFTLNSSQAQVRAQDFNGDGMADWMVFDEAGNIEIAYSDMNVPDLLSGVDNGVGAQTTIVYKSSVHQPNTFLPFAVPVIDSVTSLSLTGSLSTRYDYRNGLWDADAREFRGFGMVKTIDVEGNYSEAAFHQDTLKRGRLQRQEAYDAEGNIYSRTENTWSVEPITDDIDFVYLERKDNFIFDGGDASITPRRTAEIFEYDAQYGTLTKAIQLGEVSVEDGSDIGMDTRTVETFYVHNESDWILGLPRETVVKDNSGAKVRQAWFYYDGQGNTADPDKGFLTKKEDWAGSGALHPTTLYAYDVYGNLRQTTDARGYVTRIDYDDTYHIFPLTTTNALNHSVVNEYYGVNGVLQDSGDGFRGLWGQLKSTTDPNNEKGTRIYDVFGRVVKTISPLDSFTFPTIESDVVYFPDYVQVRSKQRVETGMVKTIDSVSFSDGSGRLIQNKLPTEHLTQFIVRDQSTLNARGLPHKQYLPYFTPNGLTVIDAINPARAHTTIEYDAMGRVVKTVNPDGTYATVDYQGWTTVAINENGHKQESDYDAYGRLVEKREYTGADGRSGQYPASTYQVYATTQYEYDSEGNLNKTIDAHHNQTIMAYDVLGRKISMDDPDMGVWTYTYDLNGNLIEQTDAKNQTIKFEYDALNRLTRKYTDDSALNVVYTYDDPLDLKSKGRLSKVNYSDGMADFDYDEIGREVNAVKEINAQQYTIERDYDALNNLINITYPNQEKIFYDYNDAGQIEAISNDPALFDQQSFLLQSTAEFEVAGMGPGTRYQEPGAWSQVTGRWSPLNTIKSFYANFFEPYILGIKPAYAQTMFDFSDFTEVDETDSITKDNNCVSFTNIPSRETDSYVLASHVSQGDFVYEFDTVLSNADTFMGELAVWGITNTDSDTYDSWTDGAMVSWDKSGSNVKLELENMDGSSISKSFLNLNQRYYLTVRREGSQIYLDIYETPSKRPEDLVATLNRSFNTTAYSYVYALSPEHRASDSGHKATGDTCHLSYDESGGGAPDTDAPSIPLNSSLGSASETTLLAGWNSSTDNVGVAGYYIDVASNSTFTNFVTGFNNKNVGNNTSSTVTGLSAETAYYLRVRAYDAAGNISASSTTASGITLAASGGGGGGSSNDEMIAFSFAGFQETDEFDRISPSNECINFTDLLTKSSTSFVQTDFKTAGDFVYEFETEFTASASSSGETLVWGITNDTDHKYNTWNSGAYLAFQSNGSFKYFKLYDKSNSGIKSKTGFSLNQRYYIRVKREGSVLTAEIFDDPARITPLETLSDSSFVDTTFNTLYALGAKEVSSTITNYTASGDVCTLKADEDTYYQNFQPPTLIVKNVDYNAVGQMTKVEYGNGVTTAYTYDELTLRLMRILTTDEDNQPVQDLSYTYDSVGNVLTMTDAVHTDTQTFQYDEQNRLTQAVNSATYGTKHYTYNEIGNIMSKDGKGYTYGDGPAGPHAVTDLSDGTTLTYDANGNMASKQKGGDLTLYKYDVENRLTEVKKNADVLSQFTYDGDGGRTRKVTADGTIRFVGSMYEDAGLRQTQYVFLGDQRIASLTDNQIFFYHGNHLGSTNVMTDKDGAVYQIMEYTPFGSFSRQEFPQGTPEEKAWHHFTSQYHDEESGLYYYNARYYDPDLGRFLTPDTFVQSLANPQTFNRYSYTGNNPVNYTDPSGHFFQFIAAAIIGAIKGAFLGAGIAAVTGGDIGRGALFGAIGGGIFSGVSSAVTSLAKSTLLGTTNISLVGSAANTVNGIAAVVGGVAAGAAGSAYLGADPLSGAGIGALSGGVFGRISGMKAIGWAGVGRVAAAGVAGGAIAEVSGNSFVDGFVFASTVAGADFIYRAILATKGIHAEASLGTAKTKGVEKLDANGNPLPGIKGGVNPDITVNQVGFASKASYAPDDLWGRFKNYIGGETGPIMSQLGQNGPGLQRFSLFHDRSGDIISSLIGKTGNGILFNFQTMPPMYGLNFIGSNINDAPSGIGLYIGNKDHL